MFSKGLLGTILIYGLSFIPVYFWLPYSDFDTTNSILRSLGQISGLIGTCMICLNFVLSSRIKLLEPLFNGLNRMYILHATLGSLGFTLIILHPVFLIYSYLTISLEAAFNLIMPSLNNIPVLIGIIAILLLIYLIVFTLFIKIEYDKWKRMHRWLGLVLLLSVFHVITIESTVNYDFGLQIYMYLLFIVAAYCFVYKQFSEKLKINIYEYVVSDVKTVSDVIYIQLMALGKKLQYKPGQFAFLKFDHKGIEKESHPFSILSAPVDPFLAFGIKSLGGFTETLKLVTINTKVRLEGPFGNFTYSNYNNTNQIWIAGGIGVTPFVSMARSLKPDTNLNVHMFYSVRDISEAAFSSDLEMISSHVAGLKYMLFNSKELGFLTAAYIKNNVQDFFACEIFICGPPVMMVTLRNQFIKLGIKNSRIHTEEFSLN